MEKIDQWETDFAQFMAASHPEINETIQRDKAMSDETTKSLVDAIEEFNRTTALVEESE